MPIGLTRVTKKIAPDQPGALRWARRYGAALVCVRYRVEPSGRSRYTTVELLVDEGPTVAGLEEATTVDLRVGYEEIALRRLVKGAGATWDRNAGVWRIAAPRQGARADGAGRAKTIDLEGDQWRLMGSDRHCWTRMHISGDV